MLGSTAREDKCRTCAGDGTSCKTVEGTLDMDNLQVGEYLTTQKPRKIEQKKEPN